MLSNHSQKLGRAAPVIVVLGGMLLTVFGSWSCSPQGYSGKMESIAIGTMANAGDTLIFIADEQKFFTANGLKVTMKTYDSGLAATNAMLAGEADLVSSH